MSNIDWNQVTINLTGQALNGMLEHETSVYSKVMSDVFYKKLAKHCVNLAIACTEELKAHLENNEELNSDK